MNIKTLLLNVTEFASTITETVHINYYNYEDRKRATSIHVHNVGTSPEILNNKKVATIRLLSIFILVSPRTGHDCVLVRFFSLSIHITLFFVLAIVIDGMGAPLFRPQRDPFLWFRCPVADS
jgi:hypothetical protein